MAEHIKEVQETLKAVPETINEDLVSPPGEMEKKINFPEFKDAEGAHKISISAI
jgi:hypothetical protein